MSHDPNDSAAEVTRARWRPRAGRLTRRFLRNRTGMAALAILMMILIIAAVSVVWTPHDPTASELTRRLEGPSGDHWLGTDNLGRDLLSRLMVATRVAVTATAQAVGLAFFVGVPLGLVAGYIRGPLDAVLSRFSDTLLSLPPLIFAVAIVGSLGRGLTNAMVAIGVVLMPRFFRLARAATQELREMTFVEAARASGTRTPSILAVHVLPNISSPLLVQISFGASVAIIAESGLSFLGLGAQPPTASWGSLLKEGFDRLAETNWHIWPPSVMIVLAILVLSLIGDALRDAIGRQTATER